MPGKHQILNQIEAIAQKSIELNVETILKNNLPFSIAVDIATTKGMKHSYLGVVVYYLNEQLEIKNFAFDVIELYERHTGQYLKQVLTDALATQNLSLENASAIVTDGASNMSKAFK